MKIAHYSKKAHKMINSRIRKQNLEQNLVKNSSACSIDVKRGMRNLESGKGEAEESSLPIFCKFLVGLFTAKIQQTFKELKEGKSQTLASVQV